MGDSGRSNIWAASWCKQCSISLGKRIYRDVTVMHRVRYRRLAKAFTLIKYLQELGPSDTSLCLGSRGSPLSFGFGSFYWKYILDYLWTNITINHKYSCGEEMKYCLACLGSAFTAILTPKGTKLQECYYNMQIMCLWIKQLSQRQKRETNCIQRLPMRQEYLI